VLRLDRRYLLAIIAVGISSLCSVAHALEFEPSVGAGLAYTDNADLVSDNEEDDIVVIGYLGAKLSEDGGPLRYEAISGLTHQTYLDNTVGDQTYFNLSTNAEWEQVRDRVYWNVRDYFTQRKRISLEADRVDNIQNTNVFTLGPSIRFQPSAAHSITVNPEFRDFYYQDSGTDNQQYSLSADWLYQMRQTFQTGLVGGVNAIDYDNEDLFPNTVFSKVHAVLSGARAHSSYTVYLGATHVSRDRFDNVNGFTGDATWLHELTGHSSLRFYLASHLTNTNTNLLDTQTNPDNGFFDGIQISSDVIRDNNISIVYRRSGDTFNTTIRGQAQDLDYKEAPRDRKVFTLGVNLDYQVTPLVDSSVRGIYRYLKEDEFNRTDKDFRIIGSLGYRLSRDLRTEFAVRYKNKSSDLSTSEYTETAVFFGLLWGKGAIPRTGTL